MSTSDRNSGSSIFSYLKLIVPEANPIEERTKSRREPEKAQRATSSHKRVKLQLI